MFWYKLYNKPKELKINKQVLSSILDVISKNVSITQNWLINIIFETDENIRILNKNYRWIDSTTDVLSFHYFDDFSLLKKTEIAWEVLLSFSKILNQSLEYRNTNEEESYKLIIHSILHILGFDHENDLDFEKMKKCEDEIIEIINKMYNINIK